MTILADIDDHVLAREKALADALVPVAAELRLIDLVDYVAFIRTENFANIEDLLNSSVELYFRPGTLSYGWAADLDVRWNAVPAVKLDMEFRHLGVSVFFGLTLQSAHAGVDIRCITFDEADSDPIRNTARLVAALRDARLAPAP